MPKYPNKCRIKWNEVVPLTETVNGHENRYFWRTFNY